MNGTCTFKTSAGPCGDAHNTVAVTGKYALPFEAEATHSFTERLCPVHLTGVLTATEAARQRGSVLLTIQEG